MSEWKPAPNLDKLTIIANRIRIITIGCKNRDTLSCEFGNEFAPRVREYLSEQFGEEEDTPEDAPNRFSKHERDF